MVIDNVVADPDALVEAAANLDFQPVPRAYPGIRAAAPPAYRKLLTGRLADRLIRFFELQAQGLSLSLCHYSLVTLRPDDLAPVQRLPHVDTVRDDGLATVHYLFRADLGGTAFYRHRSTGFESINTLRESAYVAALQAEFGDTTGPDMAYINGDTSISNASRRRTAFSIACSSTSETPCIRVPSRRISCRTRIPQRGACRSTASSTL